MINEVIRRVEIMKLTDIREFLKKYLTTATYTVYWFSLKRILFFHLWCLLSQTNYKLDFAGINFCEYNDLK